MNPSTDPTITRIELTVTRLVRTHAELPPERRPGFLEAQKRLEVARVRRLRELQ